MPRKPVVRSRQHYYHITARSNNREHFFIPQDETWEIMTEELSHLQKEFDLKIPGFVLMGNHFHLLMMTPNEDIDRVMFFFMKDVTRKIQKVSGRINKIFGGRYKGCLIEESGYLMNAYKYICRNPVAAGLTPFAQDYDYSTFSFAMKGIELPFKLDLVLPINFLVSKKTELDWINESFEREEAVSVGFALKKSKFRYMKERSTNREIRPSDIATLT